MEFIQPVFINKDEFFIGFDDMTIQEKVKDVQVAIIHKDGDIYVGFGITGSNLTQSELSKIHRFFEKYMVKELLSRTISGHEKNRNTAQHTREKRYVPER